MFGLLQRKTIDTTGSVVERVRESLLPPEVQVTRPDGAERLEQLARITENQAYRQTLSEYRYSLQREQRHNRLATQGYVYRVGASFVHRFPYAAVVWVHPSTGSLGRQGSVTRDNQIVMYVGDIPDFALRQIERVKDSHEFEVITIHSCQPLPVVQVSLRALDPVLVVWEGPPRIKYQHRINRYECGLSDASGYVLAIWDGDREICL